MFIFVLSNKMIMPSINCDLQNKLFTVKNNYFTVKRKYS